MDRRFFLALSMGLSIPPCSRRERTWTILPLGDSITAGGALFHSYRGPLARMLQRSGVHVRWVGTQSTPEDEPQLDHEGYPGKSIEYLAANFSRLYSADRADIILLHAGHNHTVEENPVAGIVRSTQRIVESARAINPRVVILVAQVIPSGKLPKYSYIRSQPPVGPTLPQAEHNTLAGYFGGPGLAIQSPYGHDRGSCAPQCGRREENGARVVPRIETCPGLSPFQSPQFPLVRARASVALLLLYRQA